MNVLKVTPSVKREISAAAEEGIFQLTPESAGMVFGAVSTIMAFLTKATAGKLIPNQIYVAGDIAYKATSTTEYQRLTKSDYIDLGDAKYGGLKFDGSDESATVRKALLDANKPGMGALFVPSSPDGTRLISVDGIDFTDIRRVTIFGFNSAGPNTGATSKVAGFQFISSPTTDYMFRVTGTSVGDKATQTLRASENITIRGLQLNGKYENLVDDGNGGKIPQPNAAQNTVRHGVLVEGREGGADSFITVEHCYIHHFSGDGVYAGRSADETAGSARALRVQNNKFAFCRNAVQTLASDGWVENNDIGSCREDGVSIRNWTNRVTGNNVFGCRNGIWARAGEASVCIISNNMVDRNLFCGVIAAGTGTQVVNNTFHLNSVGNPAAINSANPAGPDYLRRYYNHPSLILPSSQNLLNSHIRVDSNGVLVSNNTFRGKATGTTHITEQAKYDIEVLDGYTVVLGPQHSAGRGQSSVYGGLGMGPTSRVIPTNIFSEEGPIINAELVLDSAASTSLQLLAAQLFFKNIVRTGTATGPITDTLPTAQAVNNNGVLTGLASLPSLGAAPVAGANATPNAKTHFQFRYVNDTTQTITIGTNTGFTLIGTMTIGPKKYRDFVLNITGSTAAVLRNIGSGDLNSQFGDAGMDSSTARTIADAAKLNLVNRHAYAVVIAGSADTQFEDISGNTRNLLVDPANTGAFTYNQRMCTLEGAATGLVIPGANFRWNPSSEWLITSITGKWSHGVGRTLFSVGYSSTTSGFVVGLTPAGNVEISPSMAGTITNKMSPSRLSFLKSSAVTLSGTFTTVNNSKDITYSTNLPRGIGIDSPIRGTGIPEGAFVTDVVGNVITLSVPATADGSGLTFTGRTPTQDVTVSIAFDPQTGSWYLYRDNVLVNAWTFNNRPGTANAYPDADTTNFVRLGGASGDTSACQASQLLAFHVYKGTGRLPNTLGTIARRLTNAPKSVLSEEAFVFPVERFLMGILGQSNEAGAGGGTSGTFYIALNSGDGAPMHDGTIASGGGGYNTRWPALAGMVGQRRKWMDVLNYARGTTSLADTWVGRLRAYASSMYVTPGSYVLDNGRVYKAVGTLGTQYQITTAPSGGVSGGLTAWTDMGAARSQDVAGYVYPTTDAYFDPNGIMATMRTGMTEKAGYDRKAILVSIGQSDTVVQTTRAQYSSAMQYVAAFFTSSNIHVFLAMTSTSPNSDTHFTNNLRPGRLDALAALVDNSLVHDGGDVASLGLLTQETAPQPAAMTVAPAYINNGTAQAGQWVHLNAAAQQQAAKIHDAALVAAGW